jgi:hypothetical protein
MGLITKIVALIIKKVVMHYQIFSLFLFKFYFIILHLLTCVYIIWATSLLPPALGQNFSLFLVIKVVEHRASCVLGRHCTN